MFRIADTAFSAGRFCSPMITFYCARRGDFRQHLSIGEPAARAVRRIHFRIISRMD